ncbi:hypothetical protein GQ44DRAFT_718196 [Phaeosphaeriaceae sp. PMI808]|nr:hypothetical protein GQ44DRAFT_718196 [Phaeosphaeriaceae sp. PMI808]
MEESRNTYRSGKSLDLLTALSRVRTMQCIDARDKVYATLGVVTDGITITADYMLSTSEVFRSVTARCIKERNDLSVLDLCSGASTSSYPSWTVDWTNDSELRTPLLKQVYGWADSTFYTTGGPAQLTIRFDNQYLVLSLIGAIVDSISFVGKPLNPKLHSYEFLDVEDSIFSAWLPHLTGHDGRLRSNILCKIQYKPTGESMRLACRRTLLLDVFLSQDPWIPKRITVDDFEDLSTEDIDDDLIRNGNFLQFWHGRTFFATPQGYIGLAPIECCIGDIVCIFFGAVTPYILRPTGDGRYNFVGECYVHGIMDGEFYDALRKEAGGGAALPATEFKIV